MWKFSLIFSFEFFWQTLLLILPHLSFKYLHIFLNFPSIYFFLFSYHFSSNSHFFMNFRVIFSLSFLFFSIKKTSRHFSWIFLPLNFAVIFLFNLHTFFLQYFEFFAFESWRYFSLNFYGFFFEIARHFFFKFSLFFSMNLAAFFFLRNFSF